MNIIDELAGLLPPAPGERELPARQLRKDRLLAAIAAEPAVQPALLSGTRIRRRMPARLVVPLASAAAVLVIAALAVAVPQLSAPRGTGTQQRPAARGWVSGPPGPPPAGSRLTGTRHWTVPAARLTSVTVSASAGVIIVTGGSAGAAGITARPVYQGAAPVLSSRLAAGALTIRARCPQEPHCLVALSLHVPATLPVKASGDLTGIQLSGLAGRMSASTQEGGITLTNLHGQVSASTAQGTIRLTGSAGGLTAATQQGDITLAGFSGPVNASTAEGNITARLSSPRATLTSQQGTVSAVFWTVPGQVSASSQQGSVTVRVPASAVYHVLASTQRGSVSVTVPRSARSAHVIRASTQQGSVTVTG